MVYGAVAYAIWRFGLRPLDTSGPLVRCRVVHPYGVAGRGLRIRRPDGAILAVALADDKGAAVDAGDEVWCVDPREGRRLLGVRWNPVLLRGEAIVGTTAPRLVIPPGAVPRSMLSRAVQDQLPGAHDRRRPLVIAPLGPPPPEPPDGVDERQARVGLAHGKLRSATAPDVPLEIVTIDSEPPSAYAPRRADVTVRRADGTRLTWSVTMEHWPAMGTSAWSTRAATGEQVRLVVPTPAGDVVVVEPHEPARRADGAHAGHPDG